MAPARFKMRGARQPTGWRVTPAPALEQHIMHQYSSIYAAQSAGRMHARGGASYTVRQRAPSLCALK